MALPKEQFLVGQPKRAPKGKKPSATKGTLTPAGKRNAGSSVILHAARGRGRMPKNNVAVGNRIGGP